MNLENLDSYKVVNGIVVRTEEVSKAELAMIKTNAESEIQQIINQHDKIVAEYNTRIQYWTNIITKINNFL